MKLFQSKEDKFWTWFKSNQAKLANNINIDFDKVLDEILNELHKYNDSLFIEVGAHDDQYCELIITAHGNKEHFQNVQNIVDKAPKIPYWLFTAFKQPNVDMFKVNYADICIDTKEIWFEPLHSNQNPNELGFQIFVKGFNLQNEKKYYYAVDIILMTILGEELFGNEIDYIDIVAFPEEVDKYIPISQLSQYIEWSKNRSNS